MFYSILNRIERLGDFIINSLQTEISTAYKSNSSLREAIRCIKIGSYLAIMLILITAIIL